MRPKRWNRKKVEFAFLNGAAGAGLIDSETVHYEGDIRYIKQVNGSNAGTRTAQLTIEDEDSVQIWDGTAKAHNASYDHEFINTNRVLTGKNTLKCTVSGDPGVGGYTVTAYLYLYGREG